MNMVAFASCFRISISVGKTRVLYKCSIFKKYQLVVRHTKDETNFHLKIDKYLEALGSSKFVVWWITLYSGDGSVQL